MKIFFLFGIRKPFENLIKNYKPRPLYIGGGGSAISVSFPEQNNINVFPQVHR